MRNHLITGKAAGTIPAHPAINTGNKSPHSCKAPTPHSPLPPPHSHSHSNTLLRVNQPERKWLPEVGGTVSGLRC